MGQKGHLKKRLIDHGVCSTPQALHRFTTINKIYKHHLENGWHQSDKDAYTRLPRILCDFYRGLFLFYGCVDRRSHICNIIYSLLTRVERHRPACDYFACSGYGRHVGRCSSAIFCLFTIERNGICNVGRVCCKNLLADGDGGFADNSTLIDTTPAEV
ncbi:hypothetical protein RRG08_008921 [Elysia crispata]|uniref:Uncharacterized protein n=1 Tax=Elysia crispata TaxID=231223 RepID=A0AAE1DNG8_9GAST|nr:hypothetical protein RRG08_008921 [Elysia crispata]